jgi:hypothetical protein
MSEIFSNALSPIGGGHGFGLFFAHHVRVLFAVESRGVSIGAPDAVVEYMRKFHDRMLKALSRSNPYNRWRSLESESRNFRALRGYRAEFPRQAEACGVALAALAAEQKREVGRPRSYAKRALDKHITDNLANARIDQAKAPFMPGGVNSPSRSRLPVLVETLRLAEADGAELGLRKAAEQLRAVVKVTPTPSLNFLTRQPKKRKPERRKIRAAGM